MHLHIDIEKVFVGNKSIQVASADQGVVRKNNCIINSGDNPTKEERMRKIEENRKK